MIAERPFVSKWSIVRSYRPGGGERREGVFKALRQKGLVSDGIVRPLRARASGRLTGQVRVYCLLNQDAARLARHGFVEDAHRLVKEAQTIERSRDARVIVTALADRAEPATDDSDELLTRGLEELVGDEFVRAALLRVSERVERARRRSRRLGDIDQTALGRVGRIRGALADVLLEHEGGVLVIDMKALSDHNLDRLGAPVVLHWERWGKGQAFLEAGPGIALDEPEPSEHWDRFGFLQRDEELSPEAWAAVSAIAAGPATLRARRQVPVAATRH